MCSFFPSSISDSRGWARHQGFGMRLEWLHLYLDQPRTWRDKRVLGPNQDIALRAWLTATCRLQEPSGSETALARLFRGDPQDVALAWQLLWANVTSSFPTAGWYVYEMGIGSWSTPDLDQALARSIPRLSGHTVNNAIMELVGTLERTPIGTSLGQGIVTPGRPRRVKRVGLASPAPLALAYALRLAFLAEHRTVLHLDEGILWPWTVYGCELGEALSLLHARGERWARFEEDAIHCCIPLEALEHVSLL